MRVTSRLFETVGAQSCCARFGLLLTALFFALTSPLRAATPSLPLRESDFPSPIRLACVGDSITYGHLIPNREQTSYPSQLQVLLGPKWQIGNFGRNGATVLRKSPRPYHEQQEYN